MRYIITLSLILLISCNASGEDEQLRAAKDLSLDCPRIQNVDAVFGDVDRDIVIVGELHGNNETPEFVDALVCTSLSRGQDTVLALELDDSDGFHSAYLDTDGGDAARAQLFEHWLWTSALTDGRSSLAMLELLDVAARYRQSGNELDVVFFNDPAPVDDSDPTPSEISDARERHMADNILRAADSHDRTIVLVGNVHARKTEVAFGGRRYTAMAGHMPDERVLSLLAADEGGTSWNCMRTAEGETACGDHEVGSALWRGVGLSYSGSPQIVLSSEYEALDKAGPNFGEGRYDGIVLIGPITASPPANLDNRQKAPTEKAPAEE